MNPNTKIVKPTGLNTITSTLNRGSTGDQVKALQQYLIGMGYTNVKPDGVFGPITEAAVKQFQLKNGLASDGQFGPKSLGKAKTMGSSTDTGGETEPQTQAELDAKYNKAVTEHPAFQGNSQEARDYAASTGDFSGILNADGKPFNDQTQQDAYNESIQALAPGFNETKQYDTQNVQDNLTQKQLDYQNYLDTEGAKFQTDKTALDQNAADSGVLFSGGRVQKEKTLSDTYSRNQSYKQGSMGLDIAGVGRDYGYKYGTPAASNLSSMYNLGSNTYNPKVATGGVTSGGLSSMYNPGSSNFQGTAVTANKVAAQQRAAGLLWNKGNKLLSTGYNNKF